MSTAELKVIQDYYDLMAYLGQRIAKFSRTHRYTLGAAIEQRLQDILALLIRAKYSRQKLDLLDEVNIELEILRYQLRLAKDLNALPFKSHEHATRCLLSIGAQVGGWQKHAAARANTSQNKRPGGALTDGPNAIGD